MRLEDTITKDLERKQPVWYDSEQLRANKRLNIEGKLGTENELERKNKKSYERPQFSIP